MFSPLPRFYESHSSFTIILRLPKAVEGNAVSSLPEERGEVVEVPVGVDAAPVPGGPLVHLLVLRQRLVKLVQHAPGAGHAV